LSELAVAKGAKTISLPPLRMTSPESVPVTDKVWPLLTVVMEPPPKWIA
jgi:hypothetical protein